jgi:AcrR family transcriptional regulator
VEKYMPRNHEINQRMRAESRSALLKAASELFAGQGYFNCSIGDIAHKSQMSQGNVYWYFSSKEELLRAVLAVGFDKLDALVNEVMVSVGNSLQRLERFANGYLDFCIDHSDFLTIKAGLLSHGGDAVLKELGLEIHQKDRYHREMLEGILLQAEQEGYLSPGSDLAATSEYFFALMDGLAITPGTDWQLKEIHLRRTVYRLLCIQGEKSESTRRYGKWERG